MVEERRCHSQSLDTPRHRHTQIQTQTHADTDRDTRRYRHRHTQIQTQTSTKVVGEEVCRVDNVLVSPVHKPLTPTTPHQPHPPTTPPAPPPLFPIPASLPLLTYSQQTRLSPCCIPLCLTTCCITLSCVRARGRRSRAHALSRVRCLSPLSMHPHTFSVIRR